MNLLRNAKFFKKTVFNPKKEIAECVRLYLEILQPLLPEKYFACFKINYMYTTN